MPLQRMEATALVQSGAVTVIDFITDFSAASEASVLSLYVQVTVTVPALAPVTVAVRRPSAAASEALLSSLRVHLG